MPENKQIKFQFVVDERSAQQANRVIKELITNAEKLAKTLQGVSLGGAGGITGGVGPALRPQQAISKLQSPAAGQQKSSLAQVFLDNGNALKGLANVSRDSMRVMSEGIKRAIEEQKRSLSSLDQELAKVARRYSELGSEAQAAIAAGVDPKKAGAFYGAERDSALAQHMTLMGKRQKTEGQLAALDEQRRQMAISGGPPPPDDEDGGPGRVRRALARGARGRFVGGALLAGGVAAVNELNQQPFDFVTQAARQGQAIGTMGVATKQGDLRYAAALMQIMRDPEKRKEFMGVGTMSGTTGTSEAIKGGLGGLLQGDPNVPGGVARALLGLNSTMKERLRSYMEQQIQSDPNFFARLERFQGNAGGMLGMMRRMGFGEVGLANARIAAGNTGQREDMAGAFEAARGGGRGFAHRGMWDVLRAIRGGMDPGAAGALISAGAPMGSGGYLMDALSGGGMDVVASERLAGALAGAMGSSQYGPMTGLGMAGALTRFGFGSGSAMDAYTAAQRAGSIGALGGFLGGGSDGLATGINVLAANNVVGAGGDLYKVNALAELGKDPAAMFDAMTGNLTQNMMAQGITSEDARSMFRETMKRNINARYIRQEGANLSPASQAMQTLVEKYGGDIGAFIQGEGASQQNLSNLGAGLKGIMPQSFAGVEQGKQVAAMLAAAGMEGVLDGKGLGDAGGRSSALKYEQGRQKTEEEDMKSFLAGHGKFVEQLSQDMKAIGEHFVKMGDVSSSAEYTAQSLTALAAAADALTVKLGGTPPERARADLNALKNDALAGMEAAKAAPKISRKVAETLHRNKSMTPESIAAYRAYGMKMPR